jgi:hypothetical protein
MAWMYRRRLTQMHCRDHPYWIKRRRCAAPCPVALCAGRAALTGRPGAARRATQQYPAELPRYPTHGARRPIAGSAVSLKPSGRGRPALVSLRPSLVPATGLSLRSSRAARDLSLAAGTGLSWVRWCGLVPCPRWEASWLPGPPGVRAPVVGALGADRRAATSPGRPFQ